MSRQTPFLLVVERQTEVSLYNSNAPFSEPTGIDPTMPDRQIALRFLLPLIACVGALLVGWFITCDPNPLTTSTMLAGLVMCCVALSNPVWGVYLLIFTNAVEFHFTSQNSSQIAE